MILRKKYDFGIRINLGNEIGSGHFYRCLSIAKKLIKKKFGVVLIVNDEEEIKCHLKKDRIPYIVLKSNNECDRVNECKKYVTEIPTLIIDLPFENELYSKSLHEDFNTIIIDDLGNKEISSKLLFNGQMVEDFQNYTTNNQNTRSFLGPKYMALREEFGIAREKVDIPKNEIKNILLTFGGNDDHDLTHKIIPYFINKKYNITIVVGPSYRNCKKIKETIQDKKNFKLYVNEPNMAELLAKQDLVISSSGITAYELACIGIPCIFIASDTYQEKIADSMTKAGFGIDYRYFDDDDFKKLEKIISSLENLEERKKMHYTGRKILDGRGLDRIIEEISK